MKNRKDAKKIKISGLGRMMTYLKERPDSDVYINKKIDVTELVNFMNKLKKDDNDLTYYHAFTIALAKVIYNRPKLNRYIMNHDLYERYDISLAFEVKVNFEDNAKACLTRLVIDKDDNLYNLKDKIKHNVDIIRNKSQNDTDNTIDILDKLPKFVLGIVAPVFKFMDRHDLLSRKFNDGFIYNSTMIVSNLGSIHCGAVYHNITDCSTNSILTTIGEIKKEPMVIDGKVVIRDVVEFGINLDERIADGVYFARSVNLLEYLLTNPELLLEPVKTEYKEKEKFKY